MALAVQHTREHANDQVVVLEPHVALRGHLALALDAWLGVPAEGEEKGDGSSAELDRRLLVLEVKGVEHEGAHLVQLCISLDVLSSGSRAWDWIGPMHRLGLSGSGEVWLGTSGGRGDSDLGAREVEGHNEQLGVARTVRIAILVGGLDGGEECFADTDEGALLAVELAVEGSEQGLTDLTLRRHARVGVVRLWRG